MMTTTLLLALDIDGTLTTDHVLVPEPVLKYLSQLQKQGVEIFFVTGRTFSWSYPSVKLMPFPCSIAVQNGAALVELPQKKVMTRRYLHKEWLPFVAQICKEEATDVVVYSGMEREDLCYYRKSHFHPELLEYVLYRKECIGETWQEIDDFDKLPFDLFPSIKCFGKSESLNRIAARTEKELPIKMPVTFDPIHADFRIAQGTSNLVDKGQALVDYIALSPSKNYYTIACGDDYNDIPLLKKANVAIVMENAPLDVKNLAHIIAPPVTENGVIAGIEKAIKELR